MLAILKTVGVQSRTIMYNVRLVSTVRVLAILLGICIILSMPIATYAIEPANPSDLAFRQIKVTGDEFVVLENTGENDLNLGEYWLGYSSSDTATNIVPTQQLPAVTLTAGGVILLNNGSTETCDASLVTNLAFSSLSDTKGTLQLRHLTNDGMVSSFATIDSVTWGKLTTDTIQVANEAKLPVGSNAVWYKDSLSSANIWRIGDFKNCTLTFITIINIPPPDESAISWLQASTSPPSIVESIITIASSSTLRIPAADIGLKALQLSEIFPNPASPLTDTDDEFIELYNPNAALFDLSGFQLQIMSTTSSTTHTYTFPDGTTIAPLSFKAFRSEATHLSLSNTGGQVWFVDPLGRTVAQSDPYVNAKDGQAWVFANGLWQWTLQATPDATNKTAAPAVTSSTKTATVNGKTVTAVKGASTAVASSSGQPTTAQTVAGVTPVHPLTLVVVVLAALLYGAYEYRVDMANRFHQYRKYRASRRQSRG